MTTDPRLQSAITSLRDGDRVEARAIISGVLKDDPRNANAWYLAAASVDDKDRQIAALRRTVELDPNHKNARIVLQRMLGHDAHANDLINLIDKELRPYALRNRQLLGAAVATIGIIAFLASLNKVSGAIAGILIFAGFILCCITDRG